MKKVLILLCAIGIAGAAFMLLPQKTESSQVKAPSKNEITVVTPWEITSTDISKSGYVFQRLQLAETLVDSDDKGNLVPALAENWGHNENVDEWNFKLRNNVKFHDGSTLTAEDVVKSLTVALTKPTPLKNAGIKKITALDNLTVQISLEKPLVSFPSYLAHATTMILAKSSFDAQNNITAVVGTGPYQVVKIEPPQKVEQRAFKEYWGEKAKIEKVNYLANSRSESRTLLAQSEPNYVVFNLDAASLARLKQDENLNIASKSVARTIQFKWNVAHPFFADRAVRQALSDAIDRHAIAQSVLRIGDASAEQIFPEAFADWRLAVSAKQPDYQEIKARLTGLGFTLDAQGMLQKEGKPFKFTIRTFSDRPELPLVATALQNQWKQIGVNAEVSVGNFSDIPAGHQDGSLEVGLYSRYYGMLPDPMGAILQDFAAKGGDWGVMNWYNDSLETTLEQLQKTLLTTEQYPLKQKIAQIIYEEKPIVPVTFYQQNVVVHKALKGLMLDPFERNFHLNKLHW